jgi:uncharacterized RDD family membrane protein YckC
MNKSNFEMPRYIYASKKLRLINFILDLIFIKIISVIIILIIDGLFFSTQDYISNWISSLDRIESYLFGAVLAFFYYLITEAIFSRSLSKFFTKTIVVSKEGNKPAFQNILGRSIIRQIPFEYFTFLNGREHGLHDKNSDTFVILLNKFKEYKEEFIINEKK